MSDDLPRYTWSEDASCLAIMRRTGLYGQERIILMFEPGQTSPEKRQLMHGAANAVCEWLSEQDRQAREEQADE